MKKTNHIRSLVNTTVILFLFCSIVTSSFYTKPSYVGVQKYAVTKKAKSPSKPDLQLPIEEKETEEESDAQEKSQSLVLFYFVSKSVLCAIAEAQSPFSFHAALKSTTTTQLPLYLANRRLLL